MREMWMIRKIRKEQERDLAALAALEKSIFPDAWTSKGITETLRQDHTMALGIWKEGFFAGYVILYYVLDEGEIARIAVDPSCRRQGAAGRLFCQKRKESAGCCLKSGGATKRRFPSIRNGDLRKTEFEKVTIPVPVRTRFL